MLEIVLVKYPSISVFLAFHVVQSVADQKSSLGFYNSLNCIQKTYPKTIVENYLIVVPYIVNNVATLAILNKLFCRQKINVSLFQFHHCRM
ncbi:hypothetical protein Fmac_021006 [Flemingia macrophylla]|uniref:Uncharacterized protein n=1 Tax=Flemingia macrophylla TaxID=520843 RepID=A0ABD1LVR8_9FABA